MRLTVGEFVKIFLTIVYLNEIVFAYLSSSWESSFKLSENEVFFDMLAFSQCKSCIWFPKNPSVSSVAIANILAKNFSA